MNVTHLSKRKLNTVGDQVLDYIREGILLGRLVAGERIDQLAISEELGVSIIPVRESLRQLEAEGLIEKRPHRGVFVATLSLTELANIYVTREVLEKLATELAVSSMSPDTLQGLEDLLGEMERATSAGDRVALFDLNGAFHFLLYTSSGNTILCQIIEGLWDRSTVYRRRYTFMPGRADQALVEHKIILEACRQRDPVAAGKAVRANVAATTNAVSAELKRASAVVQPDSNHD